MRPLALLSLLLAVSLPAHAADHMAVENGTVDHGPADHTAAGARESAAQVAAGLIAHRAVYTLTLDHARGDVVAAGGTMAFEITDACNGWATRQRLKMMLTNRNGQPIEMISDYTTFESKDGRQLTFRMKQSTEQAVTEQVQGTATLDHPGGRGDIHYTLPRDTTQALPPGTLFPMWHTATIIAAAEAGKRFLALPLFDGTGHDGAQNTSVVVTRWGKDGAAPFPMLVPLPSGRVHIAFFRRGPGVMQPDYDLALRYWRNGVADDLRMDFGDFSMQGKLTEFVPQPGHC